MIYRQANHCDLDLEDSPLPPPPTAPPHFLHLFSPDTPVHDDAPPYQVWLQKVERFRRTGLSWIHGQTDRQTDMGIPVYPS